MPHHSRWRPSNITAGAGVLLAALLLAGTGYNLWRDRRDLHAEATDRQALVARVLEDHASRSFDAAQIALAGLADVAARTVRSPAELPIGVITAFIGAPFFLLILRRQSTA